MLIWFCRLYSTKKTGRHLRSDHLKVSKKYFSNEIRAITSNIYIFFQITDNFSYNPKKTKMLYAAPEPFFQVQFSRTRKRTNSFDLSRQTGLSFIKGIHSNITFQKCCNFFCCRNCAILAYISYQVTSSRQYFYGKLKKGKTKRTRVTGVNQ